MSKILRKIILLASTFLVGSILNAQNSANFTVNNTEQCLPGHSFTFTNTSTGTFASYSWNFGDNTTSALTTPSAKTYAQPGDYNVTLIGTDASGNTSTVVKKVTVHPLPVMNFAVYNGGTAGSTYNFVSQATINAGLISINAWNFGDNTVDTGANVNKVFANAGTYPVKLKGITLAGCVDSVTRNIVVAAALPSNTNNAVSFTVNDSAQCINANSYSFTNTSTGNFASYSWNFGDGTTSTLQTPPTKVYAQSGDYNITLIATDNSGNTKTIVRKVTVNPLPVMNFAVYNGGTAGSTYNFVSKSTINAGLISINAWNFGDNTVDTGANVNKVFASAGTFPVKLTSTTLAGCVDSVTQNIVVAAGLPIVIPPPPPPPTNSFRASFTINDSLQCITGNSFTFTNTTPIEGGEVYLWELGNGTSTATTRNATFSYTTPGHYIVKLRVVRNGDTAITTQQVSVYPKPTVNFRILEKQSNGKAYTFIDSSFVSFGNPTYFWDLGDGTTSTMINPTKEYAGAGTNYTIKLVVTNTEGCADSLSKTITTCPQITSTDFTIQSTSVCENGNSFNFTNTSVASTTGGSAISYRWVLGDGSIATTQNIANKTYDSAGDYNVKLIVTNTLGTCTVTDSIAKKITVFPKPKVGYVLYLNTALQNIVAGDTLEICNNGGTPGGGHDFQYISNSTLKRGQMLYNWDFGTTNLTYREGNNTFVNPRIIFQQNGLFPVELKVTSLEGCVDSFTHYVNIIDLGNPNFTVTDGARESYQFPLITAQMTTVPPAGNFTYRWTTNAAPIGPITYTNHTTPFVFNRSNGGVNQNVSLTISSRTGCSVTRNRNFSSLVKPRIAALSASFASFDPTTGRPQYNVTAVGNVNETQNISLTSTLNMGEGSPIIRNNPDAQNPLVLTQITPFTYTTSFPDDTATISFRVVNNNGNLDSISTLRVPVYATPHAKIGLNVVPRATLLGSDVYRVSDISTIAFGNLLSFERRFTIQTRNGINIINEWAYVFPPGTPISLPDFDIALPPGSYTFHVMLQYIPTNPARMIDPAKSTAFANYDPGTGTGTGYTAFGTNGNNNGSGTGNPPTIIVNANGGIASNSISEVPITVYPNPATSHVNLRYAASSTDNVTINIYNSTGVLVKTQRELITFSGFQTTRVNVNSLLPGSYIVQVVNANGSKRIGSATFLKQ